MIKQFLKLVRMVRLYMWINSMERLLKKAEDQGQAWNNSYFNDLELYVIVSNINRNIEDCQEALNHMRRLARRYEP